ncbi:hypothetical protein [Flavobacterium sp. ov086]|uniref:hypothetical protein n=1 Tax=Flavobacterium sp. ov086 TaxID=1761785 RepID=UPI000B658DED|nr:hypothetical protein [Flavobacterium sp. ov086]SNR40771.1 hypothetical protein SAMN04487979_10559 [Flavobacterium sp. ov086]
MKSNIILIVVILALAFACNKKEEAKVNITSENSGTFFKKKLSNQKLMDSLENRALFNGDTLAYNELKGIYYIGGQKVTGLLYYSLIMSNKYNYKRASYDVYDILTHDKKVLDDKTKKMANDYLKKSR